MDKNDQNLNFQNLRGARGDINYIFKAFKVKNNLNYWGFFF